MERIPELNKVLQTYLEEVTKSNRKVLNADSSGRSS